MEQIETQVSDLRYLTEAPVSLPADRLGRGLGGVAFGAALPNQSSAAATAPAAPAPASAPASAALPGRSNASTTTRSGLSAIPGDNSAFHMTASQTTSDAAIRSTGGGSNKRKSEDEGSGARQQRSKRNRYISIACNECKRRKIKCNGETPCQRCGNLNLACLYAPNCCSNSFKESDEYRRMTDQLTRLQEQIDVLYHGLASLRSETLSLAPIRDRNLPPPSGSFAGSPASTSSYSHSHRPEITHARFPSFRGPTTTAFSLDIANNTINTMGYRNLTEGDEVHGASSDNVGAGANVRFPPDTTTDPLWEYGRDEMIRLCRVHEDELGIMYPVLRVDSVIEHARKLTAVMERARIQGTAPPGLDDDSTLQLKMVMCCALAVEGHGHSERAAKLYDSMESIINRKLMAEPCDVKSLPVLAVLAGYRFVSNNEVLAWRVVGQVARLCLESGIHQRAGLMKIENDEERRNALHCFWSAYVLDRRWAFATGLPYTVQDEDLDPELPMPEEYPFLVAMISYSRLSAKVWRQVAHSGPVLAREHRQQDLEQLDREIIQWYDRVPEEVKLRRWDKENPLISTPSYNLQRLRVWTYLRLNQIRTWLYTPILYSATSIMGNLQQAQLVVDLAKDTIRYLSHLNTTTNFYRKLQVFYHQFLSSAIAVLFLASVHAPVEFSSACRKEFYLGLELVKDLSAKSWVSQRLWRTISALKEVAPRIGLRQHEDDDAHGTPALTMAGLATGRHGANSPASISPFGRGSVVSTPGAGPPQQSTPRMDRLPSPDNGVRLQSEMSRIYEGYVGVQSLASDQDGGGTVTGGIRTPNSAGGPGNPFTSADATVFQHFREMF
ncbi:fungal-specific transcription factor domain-containing protein [Sodiomyces alkalinus F11]|uniref:Fungal-specific transcription factor domain-containing protein n=1 Tax=Sodiomyces alkalinus (strain CBS 110278 / VKM F-3762 / F11) TaxID=1314773 RepID=A0A3N2Q751_SODAK|nr:fungal-specific transcription factor domain-containing protein [Sodiomyces alkalinus F11]ROT42517.1 fungal-specific transcription factor domain-containing protein [Sodiomyces alkalinus F11]